MSTVKEEQKLKADDAKAYKFNPHQPDRIFDEQLLRKYYKFALIELRNRNLTLISEFFNIAQVYFVLTEECPTAMLLSTPSKREMWFNVNFLLDEVGIALPLREEDSLSYKAKILQDPNYVAQTSLIHDINPFVVKRLAMLIAHELMHSILGHMKYFYTAKMDSPMLRNLCCDIYINNYLAGNKLKFDISLTEQYLGKEFLEWCSPLHQPDPNDLKAVELKKGLTGDMQVTVYDIYQYFMDKYKDMQVDTQQLLGNHSDKAGEGGQQSSQQSNSGENGDSDPESKNGDGNGNSDDNKEEKEGKSIGPIGELIREMNNVSGNSKFGSMFERHLLVEKKPSNDLLRALKASEVLKGLKGSMKLELRSYKKGDKPYSSPRIDPKTLSRAQKSQLILTGTFPPLVRRFKGSVKSKAVIYLDVSGSIGHMVKGLYSIIAFAADVFELDIFLFSTTLDPVTLQDIKQGRCPTTGGTDFNVWCSHLIESDYKVALIISDGYDSISTELLGKLKQGRYILNWLIIQGGKLPDDIKAISKNCWELNIPQ